MKMELSGQPVEELNSYNIFRGRRLHELKTDPQQFEAVRLGAKSFEIRFDDRCYYVGDVLELRETRYTGEEMKAGKPLEYTGRKEYREVAHMLTGPAYGLMEGWVILSFSIASGTEFVGSER